METVEITADLTLSIEEGDESKYLISIYYQDELLTEYDSNFEPGNVAGQTMLKNIIVHRIDEIDEAEIRAEIHNAFRDQ